MLSKRSGPYIIPEYSLTGDLLAYLNCGLQYRYYNRASLPPSTPVQLWFGEFIHAVLEEAYRQWKENESFRHFPWEWATRVRTIEMTIHRRLATRGLLPTPGLFCPYGPGEAAGACGDDNHPHKRLASVRADEAINVWGPHLFPLVTAAEVRLRGTRPMPVLEENRSDYYGITGVVDVIASVAIRNASPDNLVLRYIEPFMGNANEDKYEIIIDYKGMRRPALDDPWWKYHRWQVLTYAWLRSCQPDSRPVRAGVIFYLNELHPSAEDLQKLRSEIAESRTDVLPVGDDLQKLREWQPGRPLPSLSRSFRQDRSIQVIPIEGQALEESLRKFDSVVREIESSVLMEKKGAPVRSCWRTEFREETCTACDFKTFCPRVALVRPYRPTVP